jgi:hypothetical protein
MARKAIPKAIQVSILFKSRRRCCLCFGLRGEDVVKKGQLAHLDGDNENFAEDNLAFLCLEHHDEYDSTPGLSKGLREQEVRRWRDELHKRTAAQLAGNAAGDLVKRFSCHAHSIIEALSHVGDRSPFLGIQGELAGLARAAEGLGIPIPIEIETVPYPDGVEPHNPFLKSCWEGRFVIRCPDRSGERGKAVHAHGVELLIDARQSAIVALKQWVIYLQHGAAGEPEG